MHFRDVLTEILGGTVNNRVVNISNTVLDLGIVWGIASILVGLTASSGLSGMNLAESLLVLFTAFIAPLAVAIVAIWTPRTAAVVLAICFLLLEGLGLFCDGFHGMALIAWRFGIQSILFICAYMYVAHLNARIGESDSVPQQGQAVGQFQQQERPSLLFR